MGGIDAQRGFICQTYIALIECLDRNDWDTIKLEPGSKKDKIDISLCKDGKRISAIQVKSSKKPFGRKAVLDALDELRQDAEGAESICLYLVGDKFTEDCRKLIDRSTEIKHYPLKDIADLCSGKLNKYIDKAVKGKGVDVAMRNLAFSASFAWLHLNSIDSKPLSRKEFEERFLSMVSRKSTVPGMVSVILAVTLLLAVVCITILVGSHFVPNNNSNLSDSQSEYYPNDAIPAYAYNSELLSVKVKTAVELYNNAEYKNAKLCFQEAITESSTATNIGNETKAYMYYMLGLASIYSNDSVEEVSDDAVAALTTAKGLYEEIQDTWGYLRCSFGLGTAYYEAKSYNRALEICGEVLDTIGEVLESKDTAKKVTEFSEYGKMVSYHAFEFMDYDSLYAIAMASDLRSKTLDLMGKIYVETDIGPMAYKCFCDALHAGSEGYLADFELMIMPSASDDVDADIRNYIAKLKEQGEIETIEVESYDYYPEDGTLTDRGSVTTYKDKAVATILTNRAQCGVSEGLMDESEKDCLAALEIWNSLDFSERSGLSYTNNTLIIINLQRLSAGADGSLEDDSEREDLLHKLLDYADESVTYDCELFGKNHWRTALSYERRATIYMLLEDDASALEDFQRAYDIYVDFGDEAGEKMVKEYIDSLNNKPEDDSR